MRGAWSGQEVDTLNRMSRMQRAQYAQSLCSRAQNEINGKNQQDSRSIPVLCSSLPKYVTLLQPLNVGEPAIEGIFPTPRGSLLFAGN